MREDSSQNSPQSLRRNPRLFLLFRIFFNARFYYPVYAILFLDFGLTVEEFAILNFAWAVTIVLLEVPSGAFADQFGRKVAVVTASVLMILEMLVICLTPVGAGGLVFTIFLINRVLSGAAEAAASGADEALAYDSIPESEREKTWPRLMVKLMRYQAASFILVPILGAAIYSPDLMNAATSRLGWSLDLDQATTLKFPLVLTLGMGLVTLVVSLLMKEPPRPSAAGDSDAGAASPVVESFRRVFRAGAWILKTPAPLVLILIGLFYDSIVRLYYTINSSYFRLLRIEEAWFGVIGAVGAVVALISANFVERLAVHRTASANFSLVTLLIVAGLLSLAFPIPYYGVILIAPLWIAMRYLHFFISHYLNMVTDSHHRATVLSFKGLSMNLSYGLITLLFGVHTSLLRDEAIADGSPDASALSDHDLNQVALAGSLKWWALYFAVVVVMLGVFRRWRYRCSLTALIEKARLAPPGPK